jgi:hypothetical protein
MHFRSVRKRGFIERSKLRQNQSAIPARLSARRRQPKAFFGLADPAPQRSIAVETKATFIRKARISQERDIRERSLIAGLASTAFRSLF